MINACHKKVKVLSYSKQHPTAAAYLIKAENREQGLALRVSLSGKIIDIETQLFGNFNIYNLLATLLVLINHGFESDEVAERVSEIHSVDGRMQRFGGVDVPMVFLDYAHTPQALKQVLTSCRDYTAADLICVFGCGGERDTSKRPLMGEIAQRYADRIVICDDNPRGEDPEQICNGILKGMTNTRSHCVIHDRAKAISKAIKEAAPDDVVLVAGKGHERYQIVKGVKKPFNDAGFIQKALEDY